MKLMSSMAVVGAFVMCVGCADAMGDNPPTTYPQDRPVGTDRVNCAAGAHSNREH